MVMRMKYYPLAQDSEKWSPDFGASLVQAKKPRGGFRTAE